MEHEEFENFWLEVQELAIELGVSTNYIEEEFIIDGELVWNSDFKTESD